MMERAPRLLNLAVAAFLASVAPLRAEGVLDPLFDRLAQPDLQGWELVEQEVWQELSKSGSAAMDLLLRRGQDALEADDPKAAIEHLTALIDHAPDFAEGYNARAAAYFQNDQYGPAMQDLRRALTLQPRHFAAMAGLGRILEEMGDEAAALGFYRAARAIHPHRTDLKESVERLEPVVNGTAL